MLGVRFDVSLAVRAAVVVIFCAGCLAASPAGAQSGSRGGGGIGRSMGPSPPMLRSSSPRRRSGLRGNPLGPKVLVKQVRIVGNREVTQNKVRAYLHTRPDRQYDPEIVQADVHRLTKSGLFQNVRTFNQQVPGGVIVTFEVLERPTVRKIVIVGNKGVKDRTLLKQTDLKVGEALSVYVVQEARRKIEEFYHTKGFTNARVTVMEGDQPQDLKVVLLVNEGVKQRIWDVKFVGNIIARDSRLKTQIKSKPGYLKYLFRGEVSRKKIDEDVQRLVSYYRRLGYYGARVGRELEVGRSGRWITLIYVIDEGPRYVIRNVSFVGNKKFGHEELAGLIELKKGDYFESTRMNRDLRELRDKFGSQGYIFADVKADPRFLEEPGLVDLIYDIEEGDQYRVGEIIVHIEGDNPHTRRNVVLNRMDIGPGDIIDSRKIRDSERRLKFSQLFRNEPHRGITPRITVRPPTVDGSESSIASAPRRFSDASDNRSQGHGGHGHTHGR